MYQETIINLSNMRFETLLTGAEVAEILNVSRSFAYILMQTGQIPTVHLGRSVRVKPEDLRVFIDKNTTESDGHN